MSSVDLQRFSMGYFDQRMPWLPNEDRVEDYLNDEAEYPSPYPENIQPAIYAAPSVSVMSSEASVINVSSIFHALNQLECKAERNVELVEGGIVCGSDVSIRARVVKLFDDPKSPIRTTLIALKTLKIRAEELYIDGADIIMPDAETYSIRADYISFKNPTQNSQWLYDRLKHRIEK